MKKFLFVSLCLALLFIAIGCAKTDTDKNEPTAELTNTEESSSAEALEETKKDPPYVSANKYYAILSTEKVNNRVFPELINDYLIFNHKNYSVICRNVPNILGFLINITPKPLNKICSIYKFPLTTHTGLDGTTFLVYNGCVYELGISLGGFGVTEFAYKETESENILYYIYSWGSGIHRSHIGSFNFKTKEHTVSEPIYDDISFYIPDGSDTLGICYAKIKWNNYSDSSVIIDKSTPLYENIDNVTFYNADETVKN